MSELTSYINNSEFQNLKKYFTNFTPSSYIIVRFELPFQLPIGEEGGIYSKKYRKGLKVKHIYSKRDNTDINKVSTNVDIINILVERITKKNEEELLREAINNSLKFLNNIIKILITSFKYEDFTLINRFDLPVGFPIWICTKPKFDEKNLEARLFLNFHFNKLEREHDLIFSKERDELVKKVEVMEENPFFDQAVSYAEGSNLLKAGSFHSGFLKIHSCVERLMYSMVKEVFIKNGKPQKKIDNVTHMSYKNLLKHYLGPYLTKNGLLFDIENKKSVAYEYWQEVYLVRNKIVHEGYNVNENEAYKAKRIVWELSKKVIVTMKKLGYPDIEKYLSDSVEDLEKGYQG